jgi:hypothetical protein
VNTHSYRAKDGTLITGIPDDVGDNDPRLVDFYKQMKSAGQTTAPFGQLNLSPERAAAVDPESVGGILPKDKPGRVYDLVLSNPREKDIPTVLGTMGAVVRGAGPIAAGTALGAVGGSVIPGVGTVAGALAGGGAMGLAQMVGDPLIMGINKLFGTKYTMPTDAIEDLFTRIGVEQPRNEAEKLVQAVSQGVAGAGSDIMFGKALQMGTGLAPTTKALIGKAIESGPLQQLFGGAGGGAAAEKARQEGYGPWAQLGFGALGSMGASTLGSALVLKPAGVHPMQGVVDASEGLNTKLGTSDVFPPETFIGKAVQAGGERIPFAGTGPLLAKKQKDRIKDIKNLFAEHGAFETVARASDDVMLDLANKRAANFARWEAMKRSALESTSDSGDVLKGDFTTGSGTKYKDIKEIQNIFKGKEWGYDAVGIRVVNKDYDGYHAKIGDKLKPSHVWDDGSQTDELLSGTSAIGMDSYIKPDLYSGYSGRRILIIGGEYKNGGEDIGEVVIPNATVLAVHDLPGNKITVPMPKTIKSIDDSIAYLQSLKNEDVTPAINKLLNWKAAVQDQSPENVLTNKQMLGDIFDAPEMGAVKRVMGDELKKTYKAVKEDLTDFIESAGGEQAKNKWIIANKEEARLFKDLDLDILKNTLEKGGERPEVIKNMLMNKDRSVVEALNKGLTAKGRASAVTAVFQEVAKKTGEDVSPDKFITELHRLKTSGDPLGVFMQPDDYKALDGLVRVLKATTRASEAGLHTPTGQQLYLPIGVATGAGVVGKLGDFLGGGGTGTVLAAGVGITGMGLAGAAARIYESAAVRNILMQIPAVKPGSVEEAALFKRLLEAVQAIQTKPSEPQYATSTRSK